MPDNGLPNRPSTQPVNIQLPLTRDNPSLPLIALLTGGGAVLSRNTGSPGRDMVRGGLKGLSTGAGAVAGAKLLGQAMPEDEDTPINLEPGLAGVLLGGGAGYLGGSTMSRLLGLEGVPDRRPRHRALSSPTNADDDLLRLLARRAKQASVLPQLRRAKEESDRGNYLAKHRIMRALIGEKPDDFVIDSEQGDIVGITHASGFRMHLPRHILPVPVQSSTRED